MARPFHPAMTKLDTLYSVGEGRTVVLAIDTCKSCLSAFESLAASCHKTQSFLSADPGAFLADFQLKPSDRLVVLFHHANHTPISMRPRGRVSELVSPRGSRGSNGSSQSEASSGGASPSTPRSILSALLSPIAGGASIFKSTSASSGDDCGEDSAPPPRLDLPRRYTWRPQPDPAVVVRQMEEAGRADAATVVVMALMAEEEVKRALKQRKGWDRRTKAAVMRMARVARACKIRFEAIDLSDIAGEWDNSRKRDSSTGKTSRQGASSPGSPKRASGKTQKSLKSPRSSPAQSLPWEDKADAVTGFCRHINAELLLLPSSHACKTLNLSGRFACNNLTIQCSRDAPCAVIRLGGVAGGSGGGSGSGKDWRTTRRGPEQGLQLPKSFTVDELL